jgi:hypothetical protein
LKHRPASPEAWISLSAGISVLLLSPPLRDATALIPPIAFGAALSLFMTPGLFLSRWLVREHAGGVAALPVGFAISAGLYGLLGVPALIWHLGIESYLWAAGAALAATVAFGTWRSRRATPVARTGSSYGPPAGWLWAPFVSLGGVLAFVGGRRVPSSYDDIWMYLAWVRDFAGAERLAYRGPFFGERTAEFSRVKVNGWLVEQAALSRVSGLDSTEMVLRYLTPALVVLALLAVYALARVLLKSEQAAVLCGTVFALFHLIFMEPSVHNIGVELAARIPEDKYAARFLVLPVALLFAVLFAEDGRLRHLGLFALSCWTAVILHPSVLPALGLCMLGFGLARVAANPLRRAAWTRMAALALALWSVVLGPALLVLSAGESPAAILYSADINATPPAVLEHQVFITESWRHIHEFEDGSYMMHPWLLLNPAILASYVLGIPFLLLRVRRSPAAQLLLGGLVVVGVAVYVPPVATFVGEELIVPGLLWRLAWPIPMLGLLTLGWMAWEALGRAQELLAGAGVGRGMVRTLPLALVLLLLTAAAPPTAARAVGLYREFEVARTANYHPDPIFPWMRDNLENPGVLLARDSVNNVVPAYSDAMDVVSHRGEGMIRDREELEERAGSEISLPQRYLDVHGFFFGPTLDAEAHETLRRYGVDYLMVYAGGPLDDRLKTEPGFRPVVGSPRERYALYAVDLSALGDPARGPDRPVDAEPS